MAEEYDGRVTIGTELDTSGFDKGSDKLKESVRGLTKALESLSGIASNAFGKQLKIPEPDIPSKEDLQFPTPDPIKPKVDTTDLDAGTQKIHRDMEQITRDVGVDLPEPKPVEPELDSDAFDKQAVRMQTNINRIIREIDRMISTSAQGFRSTSAVLAFDNRLDLTAEKIAEAREQLAEFAEQQIPTDQYAETTASIQRAEAALLKLYDRRDQMQDLGVDETSKQWQKLEMQIATAEEEVERFEMAADRMRETGVAFVDPTATEQYAQMVAEIERAEQDIETNAGLIRQEQIEQARLNVLIAQEKYAHASNAVSRQLALKQLQNAQNALAMVADKSVTPAPDPAAGSAWRRLGQTIKSGVTGATSAVKKFGTLASKVTSSVKSMASKVTGFFSGIGKNGSGGIDGLLKKFSGLKRMLATRIKRTFISFLFDQIKESFNALAKFDSRFDQSVSNLRNRTSELGANVMATFGGLIRQIEPIITYAIEAASKAMEKLNAVMTAIRGENTMQIAVRRTESYADSLRDAAKAAKDDQKAQEKLNATLTSIDEIHKLDAPKDDDAGADIGADAEKIIYENVPVNSILGTMSEFGQNIAKRIIDGIKGGNWNDAGRAISEGLNALVDKIDEKLRAARPKAEKAARDIADMLNGLVGGFDGYGFGEALADGLNLGISAANEFLKRFDFREFGATIGDGITGAVRRFEWDTAGQALGNAVNGIINTARGIFEHTDWRDIGHGLATGFNNLVSTVDWANLAQTLSIGVIGLLNTISQTIRETDWQQLGRNIVTFIKNIDWSGVTKAIFETIGAILGGLAGFIWGLIKEAMDSVKKWWYNNAVENGKFSMEGFLNGIKKALKNLGTWIKKNIFQPFINAFKDAFGISSPAKEMVPFGEFVAEGVLNGIKGIFDGIGSWIKSHIFEPFTKGFTNAFRIAGGKAQELVASGKAIADGIQSGVKTGWAGITTYLDQKKDDLKQVGEHFSSSIKQGISNTWHTVKEAFDIDSLSQLDGSKMWDAGKKLIGNLRDGITGGDWDNMVANIWERFDNLTSWFNNEGAAAFRDSGAAMAASLNEGLMAEFATAQQQAQEHADTMAGIQASYGINRGMQYSESRLQGPATRTLQTLETIKNVAESIDGTEVEISVDSTASELDKITGNLSTIADKLTAIAKTFQAIGRAFPDMTAVPVPAAALGAIVPAGTRVTDGGMGSDSRTATLLEKLIGRIEELEEMVASRPIQLESKIMLDQREIGRATAEYNAGNSRVTNGNGGANRW